MNKMAKAIRLTARILSVPVVLIWAFLILSYAFGPERSLPSNLPEGIAYLTMIFSILALAVAWKWEGLGGILCLVAVAVGAAYNGRGLLSPAMVVPINAALFLLSWRLNRAGRSEPGNRSNSSE